MPFKIRIRLSIDFDADPDPGRDPTPSLYVGKIEKFVFYFYSQQFQSS